MSFKRKEEIPVIIGELYHQPTYEMTVRLVRVDQDRVTLQCICKDNCKPESIRLEQFHEHFVLTS